MLTAFCDSPMVTNLVRGLLTGDCEQRMSLNGRQCRYGTFMTSSKRDDREASKLQSHRHEI